VKVRLIDVPPDAPHPFEPAAARVFVRHTRFSACSRLFADPSPLRDLDFLGRHFEMGYTNLWVLERALLRDATGRTHRWTLEPMTPREREGRFFLYGDDGSRLEHHGDSLGWATAREAEAALGDPALAKADAIVVARLVEDIYWH
jgi:hypothetical protein